jgi:HEAT repeat protein
MLLNFVSDAQEFRAALKSTSWTTRFRAARLLGEIGDPEAVLPLEAAFSRRGERKAVREVIESSIRRLKQIER